jgi:hypothetical protein
MLYYMYIIIDTKIIKIYMMYKKVYIILKNILLKFKLRQ